MLLSLVLFLARTSTPEIQTLSIDDQPDSTDRKLVSIQMKPVKQCPQLKIIRIDMSIYFGSINHIQNRISKINDNENINHILIVSSGINFIDLAGAEALVSENKSLVAQGGGLYFVGLKPSVYEFAARSCFIRKIGNEHFFDTKTEAIHSIYARLDRSKCSSCPALILWNATDSLA